MSTLDELHERMRNLIQTKCNTIGCDKCDLKYPGGCSSDILQGQIMDMEAEEMRNELNLKRATK